MSTHAVGGLRNRPALETVTAAHVGFVDAVGFVVLGGFFVASIDATTTQAGVALGGNTNSAVGLLAAILVGFLAGVIAAALAGHRWPSHRAAGALALAAASLAATGLVGQFTDVRVAIGFTLAVAMGAANTLVEPAGLLVDLARALSDRLHAAGPRLWIHYLRLWVAVAAGAVVGAVLVSRLGTDAVWIVAGTAFLAALYCASAAPNELAS